MQKYKKIMIIMFIAAVLSAGISACRRNAAAQAAANACEISQNYLTIAQNGVKISDDNKTL